MCHVFIRKSHPFFGKYENAGLYYFPKCHNRCYDKKCIAGQGNNGVHVHSYVMGASRIPQITLWLGKEVVGHEKVGCRCKLWGPMSIMPHIKN